MKLEAPKNPNYAATVVEIKSINVLDGCDFVVGAPLFGLQAIVSKDMPIGTIGLFFPAETQLSDAFVHANNLYRHGDKNKDEAAKGYFEDSRRVKAMKFRGHRSDAFFIPLDSLSFLKKIKGGLDLKVGDTFDMINGTEICKKYYIKEPGVQNIDKNAKKRFRRVDSEFLPEHFDTENYWRNQHNVSPLAPVVVTQKLHGTSVRIGHTLVKRELKWYERALQKLGVKISDTEFDHVYGSRKVVKDVNNPNQNHFYSEDLWTRVGKSLDHIVPQNFVLYGEIIGWVGGGPIQKNYTYGLPQGESELYIYRIAVVTNSGKVVDLSWDQVVNFCADAGIKSVPELWRGKHDDFHVDDWTDVVYSDEGFAQAIPLSGKKGLVDEGVVVRAEGRAPYLLKAKSPIFLNHESKMLDEEAVDIEATESEEAAV